MHFLPVPVSLPCVGVPVAAAHCGTDDDDEDAMAGLRLAAAGAAEGAGGGADASAGAAVAAGVAAAAASGAAGAALPPGVPSSEVVSRMEADADAVLEAAKASLASWSDAVRCSNLALEMLTNLFSFDGDHGDDDEESEASVAFRRELHGCLLGAGVAPLVRVCGPQQRG